jgi:hypothetical protein
MDTEHNFQDRNQLKLAIEKKFHITNTTEAFFQEVLQKIDEINVF